MAVINRVGETQMMNCGMRATIIRYRKYADIDVRFEDGTVAEHKRYDIFRKGEIAHESLSQKRGSKDFHGFINRDLKMKIELFTNASVSIAGWRMF